MKRKLLILLLTVLLTSVCAIGTACGGRSPDDDESSDRPGQIIPDQSEGEEPGLHVHEMTYYAAESATCTEAGNSAYWYCPDCGKYFSDAEGNAEIEENSWVIPATEHADMVSHEAEPAT